MSKSEPYLKTNEIIGERYQVVKQIGRHYKEVFQCLDTHKDNEEVVVKIEKIGLTQESRLQNEWNYYKRLSNSKCFSFVLNYFNDTDFRFIVMKKLGMNLQTHFEEEIRRSGELGLELKVVLELGDQMISRVANCHLRNIIHRDLKPENFVVDVNDPNDPNCVYLIDFNLAKEYRDGNLVHIPHMKRSPKCSVGNVQFLSINAHNGEEQSRRDDMLSLGYSLIYLAKGRLPWTKISFKSFHTRLHYLEAVKEVKVNCSIEELCEGLPKQFSQYMTICTEMKFFDDPNYVKLRTLFRNALFEMNAQKQSTFSVRTDVKNISNNEWDDYSPNSRQKLSEMISRIRGTSPHMICA